MRRIVVAGLVAGAALTALPAAPASACDPRTAPNCVSPCVTVDAVWYQVQRILAHPPEQPVC